MNNPVVQVEYSARFRRDIKRLYKKYRHIQTDVQPLIQQLEQGETPGDQMQGVGYAVYKVRVQNSDVEKGKSGGYRVIYYVKTDALTMLITMYSKSEMKDVSTDQIRQIIEELKDTP